jgi:hypothetical protein
VTADATPREVRRAAPQGMSSTRPFGPGGRPSGGGSTPSPAPTFHPKAQAAALACKSGDNGVKTGDYESSRALRTLRSSETALR